MLFKETDLKGAFVIDVTKFEDERGFFGRSFCWREFDTYGLNVQVVQVNLSHNRKKGTLRGMHMQVAPFSETKLVRCTRGAIYDVIVDMRSASATYKKWYGIELSADEYRMLYVPEGFAHGYITLEDNTDVMYQVSQFYQPEAERGYRWDDPAFNIEWPIEPVVLSEKDKLHKFINSDASCFSVSFENIRR